MKRNIAFATLLLSLGASAQAAVFILPSSLRAGVFQPINGTYTGVRPTLDGVTPGNLAGTYGVELKRGNNAFNGDWEVGVGQATSNGGAGNFNQGQFRWSADNTTTIANGGGVATAFTLNWVPTANATTPTGLSVRLSANGLNPNAVTVASPGGSRAALLRGDALRIYAKRDTILTIDNIDGTAFNTTILGQAGGAANALSTYYFHSSDNWGGDGLTITGTIRMSGANGSSGNGVLFSQGNFVPEPASWAMLIAGFGIVGASMRRSRRRRAHLVTL